MKLDVLFFNELFDGRFVLLAGFFKRQIQFVVGALFESDFFLLETKGVLFALGDERLQLLNLLLALFPAEFPLLEILLQKVEFALPAGLLFDRHFAADLDGQLFAGNPPAPPISSPKWRSSLPFKASRN